MRTDGNGFELDEFLPYLLNRTGVRVAAAFTNELKSYGVSLQAWRLLAALHDDDGLQVGQLAEKTSIELWTISRLAKELEVIGLLRRRRDGADGRTVTVCRSQRGRALTERIIPLAHHYESVMLEGFNAEEAATLKAALRRMYDNLALLDTVNRRASEGAS